MWLAVCQMLTVCQIFVVCQILVVCKILVVCQMLAVCKILVVCQMLVVCKIFVVLQMLVVCKILVVCQMLAVCQMPITLFPYICGFCLQVDFWFYYYLLFCGSCVVMCQLCYCCPGNGQQKSSVHSSWRQPAKGDTVQRTLPTGGHCWRLQLIQTWIRTSLPHKGTQYHCNMNINSDLSTPLSFALGRGYIVQCYNTILMCIWYRDNPHKVTHWHIFCIHMFMM